MGAPEGSRCGAGWRAGRLRNVSTPPPPIPATMPSFQPGPAYPQTSTPSKRTPTIVGQVSIFFGVVLFIIGALMGLNLIVCLIGVAFIVGGYMTRPDEQAKLCPACQMKVPLGAIICGYCRTPLVASSAAPLMPPPSPRKAAEAPGPPVLPSRAPEIEADAASAAALFVGAARQIRGEAGLRGRWPSGRRIDEEDPVLLELPDGRRFAFFEKCPYVLDVVGESRYQAELRALVGAFGGALPARFRAALRREPQNPYDANAVQVIALEPDVMEAPVGYLPRGIAELWAPYLDRARATTGREVLGKAETRGGTPGKPNIGVALFLEGDDVFPWVDEIAPPGVRS